LEIIKTQIEAKKAIADVLISKGWSPVGDFDMQYTGAVASKDFLTATGAKTAFAYLLPADGDGGGGDFFLTGAYYSKGSNVLSATSVCIPESNACAAERAAKYFFKEVENVVANTYEMTLRTA
jgi:hypothetical protein